VSKDKKEGRREFFHTLGRVAAGGALVGGVGYLTARAGKACLHEFRCRGCSELKACCEPQALMMRAQMQREGRLQPQKETGDGDV